MPKTVRQVLTQYVKQDKDVEYRIHLLVHVFAKFTNGIYEITRMFNSNLNPIRYFKMLMLLHRCYLAKVFQPEPVLQLLFCIRAPNKPNNQLHKIMCSKVIPQYTLYLQKCYHHLTHQHAQTHQLQPREQVYIKINLMKRALDFVEVLYTFGRYYNKEHTFIVEYNVMLAMDVRNVYNEVKDILRKNGELLDDGLCLEIENLHQKMYVVYYNCYYYQKCIKYEPESWINTQSNITDTQTPEAKYESVDKKMKNNIDYLLTTAKSTVYSNSPNEQDTHEDTINHKTILSNAQIQDILRMCREFDHHQISQFNLRHQETVITEGDSTHLEEYQDEQQEIMEQKMERSGDSNTLYQSGTSPQAIN